MYITCEQCSIIFRLDEKRLKPTGSKVRCSQCGTVFIAKPQAPAESGQGQPAQTGDAIAQAAAPSAPQLHGNAFDQKLEGIDLAELDSILEQDRSKEAFAQGDTRSDRSDDRVVEEAETLDEMDLDFDFESALTLDDDHGAAPAAEDRADETEEPDLDMDFELAASGPPADIEAPVKDQALKEQAEESGLGDGGLGEDLELVLDDFEDALSKPEEAEGPVHRTEEVADEELSLEMDIDLEGEAAEPEAEIRATESSLAGDDLTAAAEPQKDDFDLTDLDELLDEEALPADAPEDEIEEMDLSLDLDEGQDLETAPEPVPAPGQAARSPEPAPDSEPAEDDLDLSGFDDLLDEDIAAEKQAPEDLELSLHDEGELNLDEEVALVLEEGADIPAPKSADSMPSDDLDLGGLDSLLDEVDARPDESEPEELELSLDDESGQAPHQEPAPGSETLEKSKVDQGDLEELEFELDAEFEDKPVSKAAAEDQIEMPVEEDEELDLTDIEKMLEDDTLVPEQSQQPADLDLDLAGGAEKWTDEATDELGLGASGEIDLTEIEAAIDAADSDVDTGVDDDLDLELDLEPQEEAKEAPAEELELELEMENGASAADKGATEDSTDEIDLSDLDLSIEPEKPEAESEIVNAGDIELEFQVEEDAAPTIIDSAETLTGGQTTATYAKTTVAPESDDSLIEEAFSDQPAVEKKIEKPAPVRKKKKGTSKSLVVILILLLLGAGGYFGYDYATKNNIEIPYLKDAINYINDLIHPKPKDPSGTAMLSTLEINSKFIENEKAGRIFVVTGKVRNGYTVPCKMIRVQGKLFTKGKVLAKTEQSLAGLMISDMELAGQDFTQIKQRLNPSGGQAAELTVAPGQTIPFMVVFSELPAELDEFAIELVNSTR